MWGFYDEPSVAAATNVFARAHIATIFDLVRRRAPGAGVVVPGAGEPPTRSRTGNLVRDQSQGCSMFSYAYSARIGDFYRERSLRLKSECRMALAPASMTGAQR